MSGSTIDASCILALKGGFYKLGLVDLFPALPMLVFLFQPPESSILTRKKLIHVHSPNFSPHDSNDEIHCETAARRVPSTTLESIRQFVTCCDNEPLLGFA